MNNVETRFLDGSHAMREMWKGPKLLDAAQDVLRRAEDCPAAFVATSTEGAALAAVCAALRADGSVWRRISLISPTVDLDLPIVFVEPAAAGAAWTAAVLARYPQATIVIPTVSVRYAPVAASAAAAA
jgi:hypothetical protein